MEKNDKGQVVIHSIEELRPSQRRQVDRVAIGIGLLCALIYFLCFFLGGLVPDTSPPLIFSCISWFLFFAGAIVPFVFGRDFGLRMKLADMGYAFPKRHYAADYYRSPNQPFSSNDSPRYTASSFHSSTVSINPSSGQPMSGSSGMDISGNPYGTRSW